MVIAMLLRIRHLPDSPLELAVTRIGMSAPRAIVAVMGEEISVGDRIEWRSDIDGRPVEPDDPEARTHTGTVASVHRDAADGVVAYLARCRGGVSGTYLSTVLPAHLPTPAQPPADQ